NRFVPLQPQLFQHLRTHPPPQQIPQQIHLPPQKLTHILKIPQQPLSLHTPIPQQHHTHLPHFIHHQQPQTPSHHPPYQLLKQQLQHLLHTLTDTQQNVLP
ncbi:sigma-70 domain-containing protein, partial [Staphylococcus epidermidis]|uniref:sigma-70 domain-containing protein n=1 Tax=Staphylococcus epidermidis TaxID=1282 RepID=UPI0037DA6D88